MSEIKARDVLAYLNELGYRNIEAHQLKAFMMDLKKLIKNDNYCIEEVDNANILLNNDSYGMLRSTNTLPKSKPGSLVIVEISKRKSSSTSNNYNNRELSGSVSGLASNECSKNSLELRTVRRKAPDHILSVPKHSIQCLDDIQENKRRKIHKGLSDGSIARPKTSFIRVKSIPIKPCRSDPVALYHYYQNQWKQTKIPGQDSHLDLRWTIREKMLGDHTVR